MHKFNTTRTLFPAYSDSSDIRVHLPSPPSRSKVARGLDDLWDIHQSEPHITPLTDPGVDAPLPIEDGFDPEGLSEDSPENILVNRGSRKVSSEETNRLEDALRKNYNGLLKSNQGLKGSQAGAIKSQLMNSCPGALLVYNMNDTHKLVQALSIVQAAQKLSTDMVSESAYPDETKEELIAFIGRSPVMRSAILLPNFTIQQRLLGNTELFDNIADAMSLLGKIPKENPLKEHSADDEFKDHREALDLAEVSFNLGVCYDIAKGLAQRAIFKSLLATKPCLVSKDAAVACVTLINALNNLNYRILCLNTDKAVVCYNDVKQTLAEINAAPSAMFAVDEKISSAKRKCIECKPQVLKQDTLVNTNIPVATDAIRKTTALLVNLASDIQNKLQMCKPGSAAYTGCCIELACIKSFIDCCDSLQNKSSCDYKALCQRLYNYIHSLVCESGDPNIHALKSDVDFCKSSLETAQSLKTMQSLKKANVDKKISDKKLEILTKVLG